MRGVLTLVDVCAVIGSGATLLYFFWQNTHPGLAIVLAVLLTGPMAGLFLWLMGGRPFIAYRPPDFRNQSIWSEMEGQDELFFGVQSNAVALIEHPGNRTTALVETVYVLTHDGQEYTFKSCWPWQGAFYYAKKTGMPAEARRKLEAFQSVTREDAFVRSLSARPHSEPS